MPSSVHHAGSCVASPRPGNARPRVVLGAALDVPAGRPRTARRPGRGVVARPEVEGMPHPARTTSRTLTRSRPPRDLPPGEGTVSIEPNRGSRPRTARSLAGQLLPGLVVAVRDWNLSPRASSKRGSVVLPVSVDPTTCISEPTLAQSDDAVLDRAGTAVADCRESSSERAGGVRVSLTICSIWPSLGDTEGQGTGSGDKRSGQCHTHRTAPNSRKMTQGDSSRTHLGQLATTWR